MLEYTKEDLYERGKFLVETIDTQTDKVSKDDIENLPKGNCVVCYGPSSGKTTALRQFIVSHIFDTGLFATKLTDDIDSLRYDIISNLVYNGMDPEYAVTLVKGFHSNTKDLTPFDLQTTPWIICTHERLLIEPPSLLFTIDLTTVGSMISDIYDAYRKYLFVDEYPSTMYKYFDVGSLVSLRLFDHEAGTYNSKLSQMNKSVARTTYVAKLYDSPTNSPLLQSMMDNLPTPTDQCYTRDIQRGSDDIKSEFSKRRIAYFADNLLNKLDAYEASGSTEGKLYYTVNDLVAKNKYIFDGTGDIIMKGSTDWNIVVDNRFSRVLNLKSPVHRLSTNVTRRNQVSEVALEYSDTIRMIHESHPTSKILVYTWKSVKNNNAESDLVSEIKSMISDIKSYVKFVYYMSGKERVTSEYSSADIAVVLGRFYVPNYSIQMLNTVNHSSITSDDYVLSLIVQFIFRTRARLGKSIELYITDDYSKIFIQQLLDSFNLIGDTTIDPIIIESRVKDQLVQPNTDLLSKLKLGRQVVDGCVELTSNELKTFFDMSASTNNKAIRQKLDANYIEYEYVESRPSKYKIKTIVRQPNNC